MLKHLAMAFMWIRSFIIWIQYVMWNPQVDSSVSDSNFSGSWNNDTLTYRVRSKIYRGYDYDSKSKKKLRNLVVESRIYPFARFFCLY